MILPPSIVGLRDFIQFLVIELPHERRLKQLEVSKERIELFSGNRLVCPGDDLTMLLAAGVAPRRAIRLLRRRNRRAERFRRWVGTTASRAIPPATGSQGRLKS